jgi:hypothetical protein
MYFNAATCFSGKGYQQVSIMNIAIKNYLFINMKLVLRRSFHSFDTKIGYFIK